MTIVTKTQPDQEKKENVKNELKVAGLLRGEDARFLSHRPHDHTSVRTLPSVEWSSEIPQEWYETVRRRRLMTSLCAMLLLMWLLLATIMGGVLMYRYIHKRPVYYGWCGTTYLDNADGGNAAAYASAMEDRLQRLRQRVEIDEKQQLELIEVPEFGRNRPAIFVHDFKQNLTAIVDIERQRCFIKRLDRNRVKPPKSFIDLVKKMEEGYYERAASTTHENYRVGHMLHDNDVTDLGSWMIKRQCDRRTAYWLKRVSEVQLRAVSGEDLRSKVKRSAEVCFRTADITKEAEVTVTEICN